MYVSVAGITALYGDRDDMHTDQTMREKMFNMRLSAEEAERLDRVAKHYGLNVSGVVRMLVKREDDRLEEEAARRNEARPVPEKPATLQISGPVRAPTLTRPYPKPLQQQVSPMSTSYVVQSSQSTPPSLDCFDGAIEAALARIRPICAGAAMKGGAR